MKTMLLSAMIATALGTTPVLASDVLGGALDAAKDKAREAGLAQSQKALESAAEKGAEKAQKMIESAVTPGVPKEKIEAYRNAAKAMVKNLKGELEEAMKEGGPLAALDVCNVKAPKVTAELSEEQGFVLARTSLKPRNEKNTPDEWEQAVMKQFETRMAAGEDPKKIEHAEVVELDGQKTTRYMKAIPTTKMCAVCHGEHLSEDMVAKLDELYPKDQARGFKEGDLRGAFTFQEAMK